MSWHLQVVSSVSTYSLTRLPGTPAATVTNSVFFLASMPMTSGCWEKAVPQPGLMGALVGFVSDLMLSDATTSRGNVCSEARNQKGLRSSRKANHPNVAVALVGNDDETWSPAGKRRSIATRWSRMLPASATRYLFSRQVQATPHAKSRRSTSLFGSGIIGPNGQGRTLECRDRAILPLIPMLRERSR